MRRRRRIQNSRPRLDTSDPETRAVWETAQRAAVEVASWPAWKRGEVTEHDTEDERAAWHAVWRTP